MTIKTTGKELSIIDKLSEYINKDNIFSLDTGSAWDRIGEEFDKLNDNNKEIVQSKVAAKLATYLASNLAITLEVPVIPAVLLKRFKMEKVLPNEIKGSMGTFRTSIPKVKYPPKPIDHKIIGNNSKK